MRSKYIGLLGAAVFLILVLVVLGMRNRFAGSVEAQEQPAGSSDLSPAAQSSVPEQEREPNRLIHEKSPYLLQHARNPVDWYPWGEEAFTKCPVP